MPSLAESSEPDCEGILRAEEGTGRLIQRDYWGVIDGCRETPASLMTQLCRSFEAFPPERLAAFERVGASDRSLEVGDELRVTIAKTGTFGVRVVCVDAQSLTFATLVGHPEAGRITFGAYRNERGDVIFHIRSRARSSSRSLALGYAAFGEAMQTNVWTDLVWTVAKTFGNGVLGSIHAETTPIEDCEDAEDITAPTYLARGD